MKLRFTDQTVSWKMDFPQQKYNRWSAFVFVIIAVTVILDHKTVVYGNPSSKPYIPYRTDPYDQPQVHHTLDLQTGSIDDNAKLRRIRMYEPEKAIEDEKCPLQFSLGVSRRSSDATPGLGGIGITTSSKNSDTGTPLGIQQPPVIYPILPWQGPGRQIVFTTQYEHLDMLTPSKGNVFSSSTTNTNNYGGSTSSNDNKAPFSKTFIAEGLVEHIAFPLLLESSAFQTSPIVSDVNNDGILDAILTDYHGGIYVIGLQVPKDKKRRHFHKAQVPRLYVRRQWMESMVNETLGIDPYEAEKKAEAEEEAARKAAEAAGAASNGTTSKEAPPKDESKRIRAHEERPHDPYHSYFEYSYGSNSADHEPILRGVTADLLGQEQSHVDGLEKRRSRKVFYDSFEEEEKIEKLLYDSAEEEEKQEKVVFDSLEEEKRQEKVIFDSLEEQEKKEKVVYDSLEEEEKNEKVVYDSLEEEEKKEKVVYDSLEEDEKKEKIVFDSVEEEKKNEKIVYDSTNENEIGKDAAEANHRRLQEVDGQESNEGENIVAGGSANGDDVVYWEGADDVYEGYYEQEAEGEDVAEAEEIPDQVEISGDSSAGGEVEGEQVPRLDDEYRSYRGASSGDDLYPRYDDHPRYDMYDDYYGGRYNSLHEDYYDDKHYVRLPPHILCTPILVELPKLYSSNGETENLLFVPVSYYFDEDEYEGFFSYKRFEDSDRGDETETQRGMYVANAIMIYHFGDSPRWGRQEHLDLSGDHSAPVNTTLVGSIPLKEDNSKLGALALSSPTIADIDGDGSPEILMGTSMGFVYVLDARNLFSKENWPVQFPFGIESRVLVEDVRGDTNLEIFVSDVGGNVVCLDHMGRRIWHRNLLQSVAREEGSEVIGSSSMVLGDVNGDGVLDLVLHLKIRSPRQGTSRFLFVLSADNGQDVASFPVNIWTKRTSTAGDNVGEDFIHEKLPPALLVDMHGVQDHISDYIRRNGTKWSNSKYRAKLDDSRALHGGNAGGLHIVQPIETHLVIIEAGSGCTQSIEIGEGILSMVQADDVHGTNKLDLVISTVSGNVVTLESEAPFHPLNVWGNGELRSRTNGAAHGYSASQGIFVHEVSRQFRDIFGVYIPITFEIFDNRPNIQNEPDKRKYSVEIKEGTSHLVFRKDFEASGVYTERIFLPSGPGYYELNVILKTTHGLVYEDTFHIGYNVNYMDGFALLLWLPLTVATITVFLMGTRKAHWDDDIYQGDGRNGKQGILGSILPD